MSETYSCTFADCDKVFTKAYELKKHTVAHEDPKKVFRCPSCDFITLQKRGLAIHLDNHSGTKKIQCPDMVTVDNSKRRCHYKTNDPAALCRHRKKLHGYEPSPQRSRSAVAREARQKNEGKFRRRKRTTQRIGPSLRRKHARAPRQAKNPQTGSGSSLSGANGNAMDIDMDEDTGYVSGSTPLIGSDDELGLDRLFDPTLRSRWMAEFEMTYSKFDRGVTGHRLEPIPEECPLDPTVLDMQNSRGACLCPEWMVEAGVEGWDQSMLDAPKEYYAIDA